MTTKEASADLLQALGLSPLEVEAVLEISQTRRVKLQKYLKESLLYYSEYLLNNPEDITAPLSIDLRQYAQLPKARSWAQLQVLLPKQKAEPVTSRRTVVMMFTATGAKLYELKDGELVEVMTSGRD